MLQQILDKLSARLAQLSALEMIVFAVLLAFTMAGLRGRARRRRQQKLARQRTAATRMMAADDQLTASKENDLFNEAFGDEFSETGGAGADAGGDD